LQVVCYGRVSVYVLRGQYQLYVDRMEPKGLGALSLRFEQLKLKLKDEGLFDASHKKPVPFLPRAIGVVTSIDGAALRDILHVLERRFAGVHVLIYPVAVQGNTAAVQIAAAIDDLNQVGGIDVLIVGRGGGSLEDLWAFNEEIVARAIYRSEIPVISAVGHEVDFTIADFVADVRAATPSAAAEIVMPAKEELCARMDELRERADNAMTGHLRFLRQEFENLKQARGLNDPLAIFEIQFQKLSEYVKSLRACTEHLLFRKKERFASLMGKLEALGPLSTLRRGFSVSLKLPGENVISSVASLKTGDRIKTRLQDGYLLSKIEDIHKI
jgi:exodeoxyribonuclease VII large subunit